MVSVREIKSIQFKRIHIRNPLTAEDVAGHWWFEIGEPTDKDSESYGWWPKVRPTLREVFAGVVGELNDGLSGMIPPRDPHHGDEEVDEKFHPIVSDDDKRTDEDIQNCLRKFATTYSGKWQWFLGWGQNCHTFQRAALSHCGLSVPAHVRKTKL
jgi:hypothetical protein